jgi:hypothetical protein
MQGLAAELEQRPVPLGAGVDSAYGQEHTALAARCAVESFSGPAMRAFLTAGRPRSAQYSAERREGLKGQTAAGFPAGRIVIRSWAVRVFRTVSPVFPHFRSQPCMKIS